MRPSGRWAIEKLDYVARYINVFETSMRNKWSVRYYVDLMAGPGKNRLKETGQIILGSPLLALTTTYPFTDYFFADLSEGKWSGPATTLHSFTSLRACEHSDWRLQHPCREHSRSHEARRLAVSKPGLPRPRRVGTEVGDCDKVGLSAPDRPDHQLSPRCAEPVYAPGF